MVCSKTVPTTEHIYVPNHAWGLVHPSLRRARGLCRPPSTFTFPTMPGTRQPLPMLYLGFASITLRPQLEDCSSQLHMNWTHIQLRGDFNFLDLATRLILTFQQARGLHRYDASGDASQHQNFYVDFSF